MGRNFMQMQKERDLKVQRAAQQTYVQFVTDCFCIALNDPEVMGKDTLGWRRMQKVLRGAMKNFDALFPALESKNEESDYCRVQLDGALRQIFPEEDFIDFEHRYDYVFDLKPIRKERKK